MRRPASPSARDALAAEVGGEALAEQRRGRRARRSASCSATSRPSSRRWPRKSDGAATAVASILAATPLAALREAYPGRPVYRFIPSLPVEVRQGAVVQAAGPGRLAGRRADTQDAALDASVAELFAELGTLVVLDDALVDVAMGLMSCAPAYVALVAEAQIDAGVRRGIPAAQGAELVVQTLAGTAELLRRRGYDTMAVRREVSSPGGLTARGLDALERAGLRARLQRRARRGARRRLAMMLASARTEVAGFLSTLIYVYTLLIILYIVVQLLFAAGLRPPYSRTTDARARLPARRRASRSCGSSGACLPQLGGFDFSPMLAIITLYDHQHRGRPGHHPRLRRCVDATRLAWSARGARGCVVAVVVASTSSASTPSNTRSCPAKNAASCRACSSSTRATTASRSASCPATTSRVTILIALALLALLVYFARHTTRPLIWLPTGMLIGGALGNVLDRVRHGSVTDFIKLPLGWPPFNLADASITLGILILFLVVDRARHAER